MMNRNTLFFLVLMLASLCPEVTSAQYAADYRHLPGSSAVTRTHDLQPYASVAGLKKSSSSGMMLSASALPGAGSDPEANVNLLGMTAGIGYGKFRYVVEGVRAYDFDWCAVKYAGITLENILGSVDERVSVDNELLFSTFSTTASAHFADSVAGNPTQNYYDINLKFAPSLVSLSHIARYRLTKGEFRYYVGVGFYNSFVITATNKKEISHTLNGITTASTEQAVPKPATHGLMLLASTGISYRNIGLEFRFDPGRNYTNKLNYSLYMPQFTGMLHVQFIPKKQ